MTFSIWIVASFSNPSFKYHPIHLRKIIIYYLTEIAERNHSFPLNGDDFLFIEYPTTEFQPRKSILHSFKQKLIADQLLLFKTAIPDEALQSEAVINAQVIIPDACWWQFPSIKRPFIYHLKKDKTSTIAEAIDLS